MSLLNNGGINNMTKDNDKVKKLKRNIYKLRVLHHIITSSERDYAIEYMAKNGAKMKKDYMAFKSVPLEIMEEVLTILTK